MSEMTSQPTPTRSNGSRLRLAHAISNAGSRIGLVVGEAASDVLMQVRREVPLFVTAFKPEVFAIAKAIVALVVAAFGGLMTLAFLSISLMSYLSTSMPWSTAALTLAGIWGLIGLLGALVVKGQVSNLLAPPSDE